MLLLYPKKSSYSYTSFFSETFSLEMLKALIIAVFYFKHGQNMPYNTIFSNIHFYSFVYRLRTFLRKNESDSIKKRPAEVRSTSLWMFYFFVVNFVFFYGFLRFSAFYCAFFTYAMPNVSSRLPLFQSAADNWENRSPAVCSAQRPAFPSDTPCHCT